MLSKHKDLGLNPQHSHKKPDEIQALKDKDRRTQGAPWPDSVTGKTGLALSSVWHGIDGPNGDVGRTMGRRETSKKAKGGECGVNRNKAQ